ncbi:ATP phosphoribosyltransferase [Helicobacter monodelphidis]|uniref:ATP phosphoribosyltransferase n=1 Tax=Helicobacter sp. 15-1451 TaxID=2004995 RepID=UPI000DCEE6DD|nr:ATP phosphoribosyltransferase [Helicobacter sp. 15-1451]RAX58974.1 ATP phosphoribosyltransferase [Helicobacter sp. 15-1451]
MLTIALPKGRIATQTLELFEKILQQRVEFENRKLILHQDNIRFLLVRNQDVPAYVEHQAADLGVVGLDVLEESSSNVMRLLDLGLGKCRVVVGSLENAQPYTQKPIVKVATKMVNITKSYFASKAIAVETIKLYGSIELAPLVGLSDVIVDIVETGETMAQNHLKIDEVILHSSAYLVANSNSFYAKQKGILQVKEQLEKIL